MENTNDCLYYERNELQRIDSIFTISIKCIVRFLFKEQKLPRTLRVVYADRNE